MADNTSEDWRPVVGFAGYEVSNAGRVRSLDRKVTYSDGREGFIRGRDDLGCVDRTTGYRVVTLNSTNKRAVHRLVSEAFLSGPCAETVNHRNGIKTDNRAANLEWATYRKNNRHARDTGLQNQHGENTNWSKFSDHTVEQLRKTYASKHPTFRELGEMFGMSTRHAWQIINGETRVRKTIADGGAV